MNNLLLMLQVREMSLICSILLLGHLPYFASGVSQQRNVAKQKNKPLAIEWLEIKP